MPKLVLFDIDGTLIDSGGAGTRSLDAAFQEVFSIRNGFAGIRMAGKTDIKIVKEGLAAHDIPFDNGIIPEFVANYVKNLKIEIGNDGKHIKPGIKEILEKLEQRDGCHLGLLTGNIEQGARVKLGAFDLNKFFPAGAFGSDDEDRNRLLPIAVEKFTAVTGRTFLYNDCVVIGDTPRDVECSKPYGAVSIAVSTGPYGYESLRKTGAALVLNDLSDTERVFDFILDPKT